MKERSLKIKIVDLRGDGEPEERVLSFSSHRAYLRAMKEHMNGAGHRSEQTWSIIRKYPTAQGGLFERQHRTQNDTEHP